MKEFFEIAMEKVTWFLDEHGILGDIIKGALVILAIVFIITRIRNWRILIHIGKAAANDSINRTHSIAFYNKFMYILRGGDLRDKYVENTDIRKIPFFIALGLLLISGFIALTYGSNPKMSEISDYAGIIALFILKWAIIAFAVGLLGEWNMFFGIFVALGLLRFTNSWFFTFDGNVLLEVTGTVETVLNVLLGITAIPTLLYILLLLISKIMRLIMVVYYTIAARLQAGITYQNRKNIEFRGTPYSWFEFSYGIK